MDADVNMGGKGLPEVGVGSTERAVWLQQGLLAISFASSDATGTVFVEQLLFPR